MKTDIWHVDAGIYHLQVKKELTRTSKRVNWRVKLKKTNQHVFTIYNEMVCQINNTLTILQ